MLVKLAAIWYTHFTQGLHTTLPYVLSVYMIRMFLLEEGRQNLSRDESYKTEGISEELVGFRTGILGAAFCFAQTLTSFWLGRLSDRIGRRWIIIVGNVSCAVGVLFFGLSGSFLQACIVRLAMGATNGIIGAEKAMIGDVLSREEQPEAMGYISMTWGIGTLVGPMIGGVLSNPCMQGFFSRDTGVCSPHGLFEKKPFFLPCLVASAISVIAVVMTVWFLEENIPLKENKISSDHCNDSVRLVDATRNTYNPVPSDDVSPSMVGKNSPMTRQGSVSLFKKNSDLFRYDSDVNENQIEIEMGVLEKSYDDHENLPLVDSSPLGSTPPAASNFETMRIQPWYKQKNILLALSGYALIAFCYIILDELVPIFASADLANGGLAYSTSKLSGPLSFSGVVLIVWMLVGYPWVSRKFGTIRTCIIGLCQTIPTTLLFPLSSMSFLPADVVFWVGMGMKSIAGSNAFTSCLVLVNLAAPKESLGEVNGLGQTLASGVRALGPFLGGVMWAGSIRFFTFLGGGEDQEVWGHQFLPFLLSTIVAVGCIFIYLKLHIPDVR